MALYTSHMPGQDPTMAPSTSGSRAVSATTAGWRIRRAPFGAGAGHHDSVSRCGEGQAHLIGDQGRVIIDEQQVRHDASPRCRGARPEVPCRPVWHSIRCWVVGSTRSRGMWYASVVTEEA